LENTERAMLELPPRLRASPLAQRLSTAVDAVTSAGAALMSLRGAAVSSRELGSQLKTSVDVAAESWVLALLRGRFPEDRFLAEEAHAESDSWGAGRAEGDPFWTVDALDGTRSYVEGYDGFCVQLAYIDQGRAILGVVAEPVAGRCLVAVDGCGAYEVAGAASRTLEARTSIAWPARPRFVDSTLPSGRIGRLFAERHGEFVECGSVGLKACRVAEGRADVYAKEFTFRLWDVAPAEVILRETGCGLRLLQGDPIDYSGRRVEFKDLIAAPLGLLELVLASLAGA
jgi:3'(2'), 5'-bisphosphate nucleotidase